MFWIGLIIGAVIGGISSCVYFIRVGLKATNTSWSEFCDIMELLIEAGENRESVITVTHNDEVIDSYTLSEM